MEVSVVVVLVLIEVVVVVVVVVVVSVGHVCKYHATHATFLRRRTPGGRT